MSRESGQGINSIYSTSNIGGLVSWACHRNASSRGIIFCFRWSFHHCTKTSDTNHLREMDLLCLRFQAIVAGPGEAARQLSFHGFQHNHDLPFPRFCVQLLLEDFLCCLGVFETQGLMHTMHMCYHQAIPQESGACHVAQVDLKLIM